MSETLCWVAFERTKMDDPPAALDTDERAEPARLRREVAQFRMGREFPKKAFALFATENQHR
ncbi:UNVERIFIED_CONTAM: hypothetical protein RF648_11740 [Kocuria sp. CPCC 205274]